MEDAAKDLAKRSAMLTQALADADSTLHTMHPDQVGSDESLALHALEAHVMQVEGEIDAIRAKMPRARKKHKRPHIPGHLRARKKKVVEGQPVCTSANYVKTIMDLERRCEDDLQGEDVKMVWAMVFKMPKQPTDLVSKPRAIRPVPGSAPRALPCAVRPPAAH